MLRRDRPWHHLPIGHVLSQLETSAQNGLNSYAVIQRQSQFGDNSLTKTKRKRLLKIWIEQFQSPLIYILVIAAIITFLLREWVDVIVISVVVILNGLIGFAQEAKATRTMEALSRSMQSQAKVIRRGERQQIAATKLVPGDIVVLQSGDKVPADLRLLTSHSLQMNESAFTGESLPVEKRPAECLPEETALSDRVNMAYSSTFVTFGTGLGVVVATGDSTEIGKIGQLMASVEAQETNLTRQIRQLSQFLLKVILLLAAINFGVGLLHGADFKHMFEATISLMVGMIPEGLPAIVTIALAIGVSRMASRHAIIRKLPAVETLGSVTVICSDKTGTLTQNEMTVQDILAGGERFRVSGGGYTPSGKFHRGDSPIRPREYLALVECLKAGALCNDSQLVQENHVWHAEGDPTEVALLTSAAKADLETRTLSTTMPRIGTIPFESQYQYMATLHCLDDQNTTVMYLKGSVEQLLPRCRDAYANDGKLMPLEATAIEQTAHDMATRGLRVLAMARRGLSAKTVTIDHHDVASGLTFLGLQAMIDPPRPESVEAIQTCKTAGIDVKMITGDHMGTAVAISQQIGLVSQQPESCQPLALSSRDLENLSQEELVSAVERVSVFARVTPQQKLRLVEALQYRGHIAAMTGDGSNDAPALQQADIGIAMGTGTEVAKEAADMVLTDDNFATIEAAVEEGRGVFDNITKAIIWTLPTNLGEGLIILVAIFLGLAPPITPLQILWINTVTAVLLGSTLIFEAKEPGVMHRAPRPPRTPLLRRLAIRRIFVAGVLLAFMAFMAYNTALQQGHSPAFAQTAATNALVAGEIAILLGCRSLKYSMLELGLFTNLWIWGGIALTVGLQMLLTYTPFMNVIFETEPIAIATWGSILVGMVILYSLVEFDKGLQRQHL
ncbi:MAG: HAD-IC family P-type ATPase [Leptolyngbya sp. SIO1E4]|nr:HAD-IC family P-type ATPase [Leptolyngbya sp. SIO1E4]